MFSEAQIAELRNRCASRSEARSLRPQTDLCNLCSANAECTKRSSSGAGGAALKVREITDAEPVQ